MLKHTTQAFQDFHRACYWIGGAFGFDRADEIVSLLQAFQLGNAGVAQVVARHVARVAARHEASRAIPRDSWDSDSDDKYPSIAKEWYPFLAAAKKVKRAVLHPCCTWNACASCMYHPHSEGSMRITVLHGAFQLYQLTPSVYVA